MTVDTSKLERELKFAELVKSAEETVKLGNEALQNLAEIRNRLHLVSIKYPEMRAFVEQKLRECDRQEAYFQDIIKDVRRRLAQNYTLRNIANAVEDMRASETLDDEGYPESEP